MTTKLTVLVAGSTGMLGSKIVSALLDKGDVNVRAMVRSLNDSNEKNRKKIDAMKAKGATIVVHSKSTFTTSICTRWYRARANSIGLGTIAILTSNPRRLSNF